MASEILLSINFQVAKAGVNVINSQVIKTLDLAGDEALTGLMSAPTAGDVALPISALETVGQLLIQNLDTTNYVDVGITSGVGTPIARIRPGCAILFQPPAAVWYVKANTDACNIFFAACEA